MAKLRIATAAALALFAATAANAADIARPVYKAAPVVVPMYDWSGFYIGINGGWGRADFDHSYNIWGHYNLAPGDTFDYSKSGGILGGHLGYNWQAGQWVFGVEGAIQKTWLDSGAQTSPFYPATDTWQSKMDWMASVTGRVGYAWNNVLGYVKGGWAYASFNDYVQDTVDFVSVDGSRNGWTLGVGFEYAFAPNWTFGVEYNYYDFGSANINAYSTNFNGGTFYPGTDHNLDLTVQSVLGRLTYKFGGYGKSPVMAKY
jgi:outer membrane immunogenic protein